MTKVTLPIATFAKYIEEYKQFKLTDNQERAIIDLGVKIDTPSGKSSINYIIKKYDLRMMQVTLSNGYMFKAASTHILRTKGKDIFLSDLQIGDILDHRSDIPVFVTSIIETANEDCYDISIKDPYLYYDANGLVHHNTITNATLVHICEKYGRTITIVPNKSLVEQTEENFIVCGLDVGVF